MRVVWRETKVNGETSEGPMSLIGVNILIDEDFWETINLGSSNRTERIEIE